MSQWHFQRIFKALTNETLKTYIRSRRFSRALEQLTNTRLSVLDIALAAGYETQESFTRAFRDCFRLTPSQYRKMGNRSLFVRKIRFDQSYLAHIHHNISLEPDIQQQPAMQLVGLPRTTTASTPKRTTWARNCRPCGRSFCPGWARLRTPCPGSAMASWHRRGRTRKSCATWPASK